MREKPNTDGAVAHLVSRAGRGDGKRGASPLRPAHKDWLHHRVLASGSAEAVAALQASAAGAGAIPWQLDLDRMEEDWFHLLASPPAPQRRSLSLQGTRVPAG